MQTGKVGALGNELHRWVNRIKINAAASEEERTSQHITHDGHSEREAARLESISLVAPVAQLPPASFPRGSEKRIWDSTPAGNPHLSLIGRQINWN